MKRLFFLLTVLAISFSGAYSEESEVRPGYQPFVSSHSNQLSSGVASQFQTNETGSSRRTNSGSDENSAEIICSTDNNTNDSDGGAWIIIGVGVCVNTIAIIVLFIFLSHLKKESTDNEVIDSYLKEENNQQQNKPFYTAFVNMLEKDDTKGIIKTDIIQPALKSDDNIKKIIADVIQPLLKKELREGKTLEESKQFEKNAQTKEESSQPQVNKSQQKTGNQDNGYSNLKPKIHHLYGKNVVEGSFAKVSDEPIDDAFYLLELKDKDSTTATFKLNLDDSNKKKILANPKINLDGGCDVQLLTNLEEEVELAKVGTAEKDQYGIWRVTEKAKVKVRKNQ